ncbi:MAG: HD domain-containing protein, partial [Firmicutes bacterium]|nr:HD domain-containing protein [Bacillota bacterium]
NTGHTAFRSLPPSILDEGTQNMTFFPAQKESQKIVMAFWYSGQVKLDGQQISAITLVAQRIVELLSVKIYFEEISNAYLKSLKTLVESMDARNPNTVGNSKRVARAAGIIALEMGVPKKDAETISMAAFLRDIGMSGLKTSLVGKKGSFTSSEQEAMKLHTEVGAVLVQSIPDAEEIASLIKHHHERWDGWGYPSKLKGEEIPLGSRIIAVADTFNAMISNRPHRPALPFEKAIDGLKAASGSQLDPAAVSALVNWFKRKQKLSGNGQLEPCSEMIQCPDSLAGNCPAFGKNASCWTIPGTLCDGHGHNCETCPVYTEYQSRSSVKKIPST